MVTINPITLWRNALKIERRAFLVGILIGLVIMVPILMLDDNVPRLVGINMTVVNDKVNYNYMYVRYCGEIGNATDDDIALILIPTVDNSSYRNTAVTVIEGDVLLRYICFVDWNDNVIQRIKTPNIGKSYMIENIDNLKCIIIFLYATVKTYSVELWIW